MSHRSVLSASAVAVLLSAAFLVSCPHLEKMGLDFWIIPELERQRAVTERQGEDFDRLLDACHAQNEARRVITAELIDGRLSLLEAAALFRDVTVDEQDLMHLPGSTMDEKHCSSVICWALNHQRDQDPEGLFALLEQLYAELEEHRFKYGTIQLRHLSTLPGARDAE